MWRTLLMWQLGWESGWLSWRRRKVLRRQLLLMWHLGWMGLAEVVASSGGDLAEEEAWERVAGVMTALETICQVREGGGNEGEEGG
jgi:hypothetical protein